MVTTGLAGAAARPQLGRPSDGGRRLPERADACPNGRGGDALEGVLVARRVLGPRLDLLEESRDGLGEEPRALGIAVGVGLVPRLGVVAQGMADVQLLAGARAGDVEQPALLLDLRGAAGGHVRGDVAVGGVDDVDDVEFEAFGGVHGAEDEVVLVEERRTGELLRVRRRVEHQLGEELGAGLCAGGEALDLLEVAQPRLDVVVLALEQWPVDAAHGVDLRGHVMRAGGAEGGEELDDGRPGGARRLGDARAAPGGREVAGGGAQALEQRRRRLRTDAGHQPQHAQPGHRVVGVLGQAQEARRSLTWAISTNFSPPYFSNGMLRRASSISSAREWCSARKSTACSLERHALLAVREDALADPLGLLVLVAAGDEHGRAALRARVQSFLSCRSRGLLR